MTIFRLSPKLVQKHFGKVSFMTENAMAHPGVAAGVTGISYPLEDHSPGHDIYGHTK